LRDPWWKDPVQALASTAYASADVLIVGGHDRDRMRFKRDAKEEPQDGSATIAETLSAHDVVSGARDGRHDDAQADAATVIAAHVLGNGALPTPDPAH
jgi:uncharacterized NAD-dependent epimerase/dehydratase family protein